MIDERDLHRILTQFEKGCLDEGCGKRSDLEKQEILLYGAGNVGQRVYRVLKANGLKVRGLLDANRTLETRGDETHPPVYHPENPQVSKYKAAGMVIVTGLFSKAVLDEIDGYLRRAGFRNVFHLNQINFSKCTAVHYFENSMETGCREIDLLGLEKEKISQAFALLSADKDKTCFLEYLRAHLTYDFSRLSPHDPPDQQYFAHDIDQRLDFSCYIDCGGFDGDTIRAVHSQNHRVDHLVAFEPNILLYRKLASCVARLSEKFQTAVLFPCGVYSRNETFGFEGVSDTASTGRLHGEGLGNVTCVKLDDAVQGRVPTFIKMDIEGAELEAIKGAEQMLRRHKPQLAVCVYHCLSHIWDIPLALHKLVPDYKFYLRNYNDMTMETVLYAFPE